MQRKNPGSAFSKAGRQVRELKIQRKIQAMLSKAGRQIRELKIQRKNPGSAFSCRVRAKDLEWGLFWECGPSDRMNLWF
jgi:hypothetical protein